MQLLQTVQRLKIFNIQRTCVYDGPGIRTTIFFQGCNLRCLWCQNPEGQSLTENLVEDHDYSVEEVLDIILKDKQYYKATGGGITLSGGEPFLQDPDTLEYLLEEIKREKISITIETSLFAPWKNIKRIAPYIDLFLIDLKVIGDSELHKKLTKQDNRIIIENLKNLIELGLQDKIKIRMVMVPGLNDSETNIKAAAEFLKSININSLELMRYHSLYEEKIKKYHLDKPFLNISYEQSVDSIKNAFDLFNKLDIKAFNTELNFKPKKAKFTERVLEIQKDIRESKRALCIEAAKLRTEYYKKNGFKKPVYIHRAERLSYVLENKKIKIYPRELLVGNFTSKRVAGQLWEEYFGLLYITFLYKINRLKPVSFQLSFKESLIFHTKIFPFWLNHNLLKKVYPSITDFLVGMGRSSELVAGFNNNLAAIAHFIANYDRILKKGTSGLIEEIREIKKNNPDKNQAFYDGTIIALQGLEKFGLRYAEHLKKLSEKEKDSIRKEELKKMSEICFKVPKYPANTFHEALQSILFIHIALCIEAYENAISFGRLDQILYPYYRKDIEEGRITYDEAKELICLFALKIDELILVNDGDTFLNLSNLFETVSTDQALTFGGVDKDGNDATNDITYMLIDACELQTLSLDMGARIHKNSPPEYLERLAEVYISGCPLPQLFSDDVYIDTLMKHYPISIEDARNYSIVGCVEPNANDDHFGNTDCSNVNLAMPFLQALKGQDYDLWNYKKFDHILILFLNYFKFLVKSKTIDKIVDKIIRIRQIKRGYYKYNPPTSMEDLLDRFQKRLNKVTKSILREHQKIENSLRKYFVTPLTSALFDNCLKTGKDVYEGGCSINSSGIQAVGVTDVADSLYAIDEIVYKKKLYTINEVINAIENNFQGKKYKQIQKALLSVPKFGDDSSNEPIKWMNLVLDMYNKALQSVDNCPRNGRYSAGYYALNVCNRYGKNTPALPSGRLKGKPLANSITPHYGMEEKDLLSALNSIAKIDFKEHAENGTTATLTIDSSHFQGVDGKEKLASIFKTFLTTGGMQLQPNVINRQILLEAYENPEKHKYLMVRIAGYCAYFNELSDEMKRIVINRTCYT